MSTLQSKPLNRYSISFHHDNGDYNEFCGFYQSIPGGLSFGEGGYHRNLIFHDVFEHWFEGTHVFSTGRELSINGEAFAMGIRQSLYDNSHLVDSWAGYNRLQGCEWNSWQTISALISDPQYDSNGNQYEVCFDPVIHPDLIDLDRNQEGFDLGLAYSIGDRRTCAAIGRSYGAGYSYGEQFISYDQCIAIDDFMKNWVIFSDFFGLERLDNYEAASFSFRSMDVKVDYEKCHIVATVYGFDLNGNPSKCFISNRMSEDQQLRNISRLIGEPSYQYEGYFAQ